MLLYHQPLNRWVDGKRESHAHAHTKQGEEGSIVVHPEEQASRADDMTRANDEDTNVVTNPGSRAGTKLSLGEVDNDGKGIVVGKRLLLAMLMVCIVSISVSLATLVVVKSERDEARLALAQLSEHDRVDQI